MAEIDVGFELGAVGALLRRIGILVGHRRGRGMAEIDVGFELGAVGALLRRIGILVGHRRFHRAEHRPVRDDLSGVGDGYLHHFGSGPFKSPKRLPHTRCHLGVHILGRVLLIPTDPEPLRALFQLRQEIRNRLECGVVVVVVAAGDGGQHRGAILGRPRHRPQVVQGVRQHEHPVAADPAPGRLQPGHAARKGGESYRTARIGAERAVAKARHGSGPRAARRGARPIVRVPWVQRSRHVRVMTRERALRELELSEKDRAGFPEPHHRGAVVVRNVVIQQGHPGPSPYSLGPAQVLDRNRDAVQRSSDLPCLDLPVRRFRRTHRRVGHEDRECVQAAVERGDAVQNGSGHLDRGDFSAMDALPDLHQALIVKRSIGHCSLLVMARPALFPPGAMDR